MLPKFALVLSGVDGAAKIGRVGKSRISTSAKNLQKCRFQKNQLPPILRTKEPLKCRFNEKNAGSTQKSVEKCAKVKSAELC